MSRLTSWGNNDSGQLGVGFQSAKPVLSPGSVVEQCAGTDVVQGVASGHFTLARLSDGMINGWGGNRVGQLGVGSRENSPFAVSPKLAGAVQVACGGAHTLVLLDDGNVEAYGGNEGGCLGLGIIGSGEDGTAQLTPQTVPLDGIVQIAAGGSCSAALDHEGHLHTFGEGKGGQIGDGTKTAKALPTLLSLAGVVQVAVGGLPSVSGHMLALLSNGTVLQWGSGYTSTPTLVAGLQDIVAIAAGAGQSFAITSSGDLFAWGSNTENQLGLGLAITGKVTTPTKVLTNVQQVACGFQFSVALIEGNVCTFGRNDKGQCGVGTTSATGLPPTILESFGYVEEVSCGEVHTVCKMLGEPKAAPITIKAGKESLTVEWVAPADPTTNWVISQRPVTKPESKWTAVPVKPPLRSYTATGLTSGQRYQFRLANPSWGSRIVTGTAL